jgi:hypothetical protein
MGTSQSSNGPGPGVPLVPPWVPPPPPPDEPDPPSPPDTLAPPLHASPVTARAPAGRFGAARRSLGSFATSGDRREMRRGVSNYVRHGYGGHSTASRRFEGTARTAGGLYGALSALANGPSGEFAGALDRQALLGRSAREVIDAVTDAVRPVDGSQDAEASREAIAEALSGLLDRFPDADLLTLSEEQRDLVIESYTAEDVFRRLELDLGKHIMDKAVSVADAMSRSAEIRDYVREAVAAAFRRLREVGTRLLNGHIASVVRSALAATLEVFEFSRA